MICKHWLLSLFIYRKGFKMEPFTERVVEIIKGIPEGKVMTYGQIAALAGNRRGARQEARVLPVSYTISEPTRRTPIYSSAASDVYKRQVEIIKGIPEGKVMTYGQIAALAGNRRGARQEARVL